MRYRACLFLLALPLTRCSLGLEVPEGTSIVCQAQDDCPDGFVCQVSLSRCVPLGYDVTPPALIAPPLISPTVAGADASVEISFSASKPLGLDPVVTLVFGPTVQRPARLVSKANDDTDFVYAFTPDLSEPQTLASLVILLTDIAGNQGASETPNALRFDFEAPQVFDGTAELRVSPPPGSVLASAAALTVGGSVELRIQTSEPLADNSRIIVEGASLPFGPPTVLGTAYAYTATLQSGAGIEGPHAVSFEARDAAGNTTVVPIGTLVIDVTPPATPLTDTQDTVVYRRAPWQGDVPTRFTVRGATGAFEPSAVVAVFDRGVIDASAVLLATARADVDGSLAAVALPSVDRLEVYVQSIDDAGNTSQAVLVRDVDWVGGFDPAGFTSPHAAYAFKSVRRGLNLDGATRLTGATLARLGARDDSPASWYDIDLHRRWRERKPTPKQPSRYFAAATYDVEHEHMVIFGGLLTDAATPFGSQEFTLWDGSWIEPPTTGLPPPRFGHVMAYDEQRRRVVLYGGQNVNNVYDDTWEWDGSSWTQVDVDGPGGRTFAAMAYDPDTRRVLLFGGCGDGACGSMSNQTWAYDGNGWTQVATNAPPSARAGHSLTYYNGRLVVLGGCPQGSGFTPGSGDVTCSSYLGDYWGLTGATWTVIPVVTPTARAFHSAIWDGTDYLYVFGGRYGLGEAESEVWASDGSDFFTLFDSGVFTTGGVAAYHLARGIPLFFGGLYDDDLFVGFNDELYTLDTAALSLASSNVAPQPRVLGGLTYVPPRASMVLSGGGTVVAGAVRGPTMFWDANVWTPLATGGTTNVPDALGTGCSDSRGGGLTVWDATHAKLVQLCGNRTFELSGTGSWAEVCTTAGCRGTLPAATSGYAMSFDQPNGRVLIFGGGSGSATSNATYGYVSGTVTNAWTTVCATGSLTCTPPPARRCAGMAFDAARNRHVLFGGGNEFCDDVFDGDGQGSPRQDTWEWNGSKWNQVCTSGCTSPPARAVAHLVYDSGRSRIVMVGAGYGDVWEWTGVTWRRTLTEGAQPSARRAPAIGYDPSQRVISLFGGRAGGDPLNDFWELDMDENQRPAVLFAFDWSASGVARSSVRSVTVRTRAGGRGALVDSTLGPDGDTVGDVRPGVQLEYWSQFASWFGAAGAPAADLSSPSDVSATRTTSCGIDFLKPDNYIYARVSPSVGDGNGAEAAKLVVDDAEVTVRYTIGLTACP